MSKIKEIIQILSENFNFTALPDDWLNQVWDSCFTDGGEALSEDTLNDVVISSRESIRAVLKKVSSLLQNQAKSIVDDQNFWSILIENGVSTKSLLPFIFSLISSGQKLSSGVEKMQISLEASNFYLSLTAINGSHAYKFFNGSLFERAIDGLTFGAKILLTADNDNKKKGRTTNKNKDDDVMNDGSQSEETATESPDSSTSEINLADFSQSDLKHIQHMLSNLLRTLFLFIEKFSTLLNEDSASYLITILIDFLTYFDLSQSTRAYLVEEDQQLKNLDLPSLALSNLLALIKHMTGSRDRKISAVKHVLRELIPFLLFKSVPAVANHIPARAVRAKDAAMSFVDTVVTEIQDNDDSLGLKRLIYILMQNLCAQTVQKGPYRSRTASTVTELAGYLDNDHLLAFCQWLQKFSRHAKVTYRAFAVDMAVTLIIEGSKKLKFENETKTELLTLVVKRCSDIIAAVRTRALTGLCQLLDEDPQFYVNVLVSKKSTNRITPCFTNAKNHDETNGNVTKTARSLLATVMIATAREAVSLGVIVNDEENDDQSDYGDNFLSLILRRCTDDKVFVRKAAQQALEIIALNTVVTPTILKTIGDACFDPMLSIRKQGIESLTKLMIAQSFCESRDPDLQDSAVQLILERTYLSSVLPAVIDRETTVQEKSIESIKSVIFHHLNPARSVQQEKMIMDDHEKQAWRLLARIETDREFSRYLIRFLQKLATIRYLTVKLVKHIESRLQRDEFLEFSNAAWLLLAELSPFIDFSPDFTVTYWRTNQMDLIDNEGNDVIINDVVMANSDVITENNDVIMTNDDVTAANNDIKTKNDVISRKNNYILRILGDKSQNLQKKVAADLLNDMKQKVQYYRIEPDNVGSVLYAISRLYKRYSEYSDESSIDFSYWCSRVASSCESYLSRMVFAKSSRDLAENDEDDVVSCVSQSTEISQSEKSSSRCASAPFFVDCRSTIRRLLTLGELAQLAPKKIVTKRLFFILQTIVFSRIEIIDKIYLSQKYYAEYETLRGTADINETVRAYAVVTLGKLCLQDEESAKRCVASLALELDNCASSCVRNNLVVILADLCVRYTSVVDRHLETISKCLKDPSHLVRKQTLTLLTALLKEDYLKWRGLLFYRFLSSLLDRSREISEYVEFCLINILLERNKLMFYNHFIESLFVFNDALSLRIALNANNMQPDPEFDDAVLSSVNSDAENSANNTLNLSGPDNRTKRHYLYSFMLQRFNDPQRFRTANRICQDVLAAVVDEALPVDRGTASEEVVYDALVILSSPDMKLTSLQTGLGAGGQLGAGGGEDAAADMDLDPDMAPAIFAAQKMAEVARKEVSKTVKQTTIDHIVPILVSLKHTLERHRSPLIRELLNYFYELVTEYKNEVNEIFSTDPQLALEIAYDMRRLERRRATEKQKSRDQEDDDVIDA